MKKIDTKLVWDKPSSPREEPSTQSMMKTMDKDDQHTNEAKRFTEEISPRKADTQVIAKFKETLKASSFKKPKGESPPGKFGLSNRHINESAPVDGFDLAEEKLRKIVLES